MSAIKDRDRARYYRQAAESAAQEIAVSGQLKVSRDSAHQTRIDAASSFAHDGGGSANAQPSITKTTARLRAASRSATSIPQ